MLTKKIKLYDKVSTVELVAPNLYQVSDCYGEYTFDWLSNITETEGNEFFLGGLKKRLQLKPNMHDQAKLTEIGIEQKSSLEQLFQVKLNFMEAKFWLDLPQFGCQVHSDSPDLYLNYQVYIYTSPGADVACVGAEFLHVDPPYQVPLIPNTGYININNDLKSHWVYGGHATRISTMFQYARV